MIGARDNLVRFAFAAGMALCVAGLMQLTGSEQTTSHLEPTLQENVFTAMADVWSGEINYAPSYAALNPYRAEITETAGAMFDPADDYWGLPRSEGVETVSDYCAACHSLQIVMQQRQTREGWDYLLTWMVEKQGMAEPAPETREDILDYLTREFGGE